MQQIQTTLTRRWQTVVPAEIRRALHINEGDKLVWIFDGTDLRVLPVPSNPIAALRGSGKGQKLTEKLLAARLGVDDVDRG